MSKDKKADWLEKKPAPAKAAEKPAEPQIEYVTSTDLAKKLGTKPTILRRWLRTLPKFQDSGYTRYKWEKDDPFLADAEASFKKYQSSADDKKEASEKERAEAKAKKDAEKAAAKTEKPAKGKKAKGPEPEPETEGEDSGDEEEELE